MNKSKQTDEIITIIAYDFERKSYVIKDATQSWLTGKASELSDKDCGKFHRELLNLVRKYFEKIPKNNA